MNTQEFLDKIKDKVNPDALVGVTTSFHFDIEGEKGGQYTLNINNGEIDLQKGLNGEAKCAVKSTDTNLLALVKGELNPMMAVMTGKVKITNPGELMKYAKLLGLM